MKGRLVQTCRKRTNYSPEFLQGNNFVCVFIGPQSWRSRPWCWRPTGCSTPKPPCPSPPASLCRSSRTRRPPPPLTPACRGVPAQLPWTFAALSRGHRWAFGGSETISHKVDLVNYNQPLPSAELWLRLTWLHATLLSVFLFCLICVFFSGGDRCRMCCVGCLF